MRVAEESLRADRAALLARDDAGRRNADTASKLSRVLQLEQELEGVREQAQVGVRRVGRPAGVRAWPGLPAVGGVGVGVGG